MATPGSVLGVIRASRPNLKSATERVAIAIHAAFLAAGYAIVAVGSEASTMTSGNIFFIIQQSSEP